MKIIIIGTAFPYRGGLAAYNERLAREYVKQGHDVEIVTFKAKNPTILFSGDTQLSREKAPADLKINRQINILNPFNWIKVGKEIRKKKADRIIFSYWMALSSACFGIIARYARTPETKIIALIHSTSQSEPKILDRLFPLFFIKIIDGFVGMSEAVMKDIRLLDLHNKPKIVSPHPIYDHFGDASPKSEVAHRLGLHEKKNYILFFGFIKQHKGLDLLIEAFADERLRQFPVRLIVAGEFYENPQPYLEQIIRLKLEGLVELRTGYIPENEVKNYFSVADIIAQPYRSISQSGITQIAYHFEKPMLVTNVGCLSEIVPNGKVGYVVDIDSKQIANALVDFYSNNRSEEFKQNIALEKQKFAWSTMTDAIEHSVV